MLRPEIEERVDKYVVAQRGFWPAGKTKSVPLADGFNKPQFRERRFKRVLVARLGSHGLRRVGTNEASDVASDRGAGRAGPSPLVREALKPFDKVFPIEGR